MATRECCVCGDDDQANIAFLELPCGQHYICPHGNDADDCLVRFFQQAIDEERNYPVKCCGSIMNIRDYEGVLNWDFILKFLAKEIEYGTNTRFRKYCSNANCAAFLYPETHETSTGTFAKCNACPAITCTTCSTLLLYKDTTLPSSICPNKNSTNTPCTPEKGRRCASCQSEIEHMALHHTCSIPESDRAFAVHAKEAGYQQCRNCGRSVELIEACNHITCECGHNFCYVCGATWEGLHGCPQYGAPDYDAEGYNQDGFHRDTGLNREMRSRGQAQMDHDQAGDTEAFTDDEEEEETVWDVFRDVVDRMDQDMINVLTAMDPDDRWEALQQERIRLEEAGELQGPGQGQGQELGGVQAGAGLSEEEDAVGDEVQEEVDVPVAHGVQEAEDADDEGEPEVFQMDPID